MSGVRDPKHGPAFLHKAEIIFLGVQRVRVIGQKSKFLLF